MRRPIALVLLLLTVSFQSEAVFGEVHDADIHHEGMIQAWVHSHDPHGSHAHDAQAESVNTLTTRDAGHPGQTGGSFDHCTHLHGVALVPSVDVGFALGECMFELSEVPVPSDARFEALTPPPRS